MLLKGEIYQLCNYIANIINPHVTDGVTVTSLSARFKHMTSVAMDRLYQIALNWKLTRILHVMFQYTKHYSHKFKKWLKFSSCINPYPTNMQNMVIS